MKRKTVFLLILGLLVVSIGGCGGNSSNLEDGKEKVTVLLDWFPNTNHTGLYVAREQGFYESEGLQVDIVQPSEGGTEQLIAAGQGDFGISYQEGVTAARSENLPVVAIGAVIQHNTSGFASPLEKGIRTPDDFEGKTYGGWGSPAETALIKALMGKYNADFEKVKMLNIGEADFFTSVKKNVDFSWIFYGWTGIEAELRNMDLNFIKLRDEDESLDFYTPVIIAAEDMLENNPELVKKFMRATAKGYEFAIDNPEEAAGIFLKSVPELNEDLVKASQEYLSAEYRSDAPRWGEMKPKVWENYANFMFTNDLIEKQIDAEQAFTNDFLP
jgi:ABC-type nitrate/sulfonate/bicarbonate transport system substrate-binding protein